MWQVLSGVAHIHQHGLFHRDIKPENILLTHHTLPSASASSPRNIPFHTAKLADFGLVKDLRSRPPFTPYVSTRWYRAPELLSHSAYSSPIDLWATGCILAELHCLTPLFPGTSDADMLARISALVPSPTLPSPPSSLSAQLRGIPAEALELITGLLHWEPRRRWTARQALQSEYFAVKVGREVADVGQSEAEAEVAGEWVVATPHGVMRTRYFPAASAEGAGAAEGTAPAGVATAALTPTKADRGWETARRGASNDEVEEEDEVDELIRQETARAERETSRGASRRSGELGLETKARGVEADWEQGGDSRPQSTLSGRSRRMNFAALGSAIC